MTTPPRIRKQSNISENIELCSDAENIDIDNQEQESRSQRSLYLQKILKEMKQEGELIEYNLHVVVDDQNKCDDSKKNKRTRSEVTIVEDELIKQNKSSTTYASITRASMVKLLNAFVESGMQADDGFCDIGSGMGYVVFTAAINYNVKSIGVELAQVRHDFAQKQLQKQLDQMKDNNDNDIYNRLCKIQFIRDNVINQQTLQINEDTPVQYLYAFNARMSKVDNIGIAKLIIRSPHVKVIIWCCNAKYTNKDLGLNQFTHQQTITLATSKEHFQFYVYYKYELIPQQVSTQFDTKQQYRSQSKNNSILGKRFQADNSSIKEVVSKLDKEAFKQIEMILPINMQKELLKAKEYMSENTAISIMQKALLNNQSLYIKAQNRIQAKPSQKFEILCKLVKILDFTLMQNKTMCLDTLINSQIKSQSMQLGQFHFTDANLVKGYIKEIQQATKFIKIVDGRSGGDFIKKDQIQTYGEIETKLKKYCNYETNKIIKCNDKQYRLNISVDTREQLRSFLQSAFHTDIPIEQTCNILESAILKQDKPINSFEGDLDYKYLSDTKNILESEERYLKLDYNTQERLKDAACLYLQQCQNIKDKDNILYKLKLDNDNLLQMNTHLQTEQDNAYKFYASKVYQLTLQDKMHHSEFSIIYHSTLLKNNSDKDDNANKSIVNQQCAAKVFVCDAKSAEREMQSINQLNQSAIAKSLYVTNIIKQIELLGKPTVLYTYYQQNLYSYIKQRKQMSALLIRVLIYYIMKCIHDAHSNQIYHNNLKLDDILIHQNGIVTINGWFSQRKKLITAVHQCSCPDDFDLTTDDKDLNKMRRDYWSVGAIIYFILQKQMPYCIETLDSYRLLNEPLPINLKGYLWITSPYKDFITSMIDTNPQKRMSIESAMKHKYFDDFHMLSIEQLQEKLAKEFQKNG